MRRNFKDESGSVTVEATISLSVFMFAIVTILTIVNICIVQAKMSIAINASAKELSHYSYLYSLTGIHSGHQQLAEAAGKHQGDIDGVLSDVNTVFTEIQNIGKGKNGEEGGSPQDVTAMLDGLESSYTNISEAGGSLKEQLEELAKDPKSLAMGLVKIAGNDAWNATMSRLIAAPLAKGLCKKNLTPKSGGDVEGYLKYLGVVPAANGSYIDGLDFSQSSLFVDGSNEIRITVSYDVKIIPLLPLDFSFHFTQTAVTHGWLTGDESYRTTLEALDTETNSNIWTEGTMEERASLIRHQGIKEYVSNGYEQVSGKSFSDVHVYNSETNEFAAFYSMNPLYSAEGEKTLTLNDISDAAIKEQIEHLCAGIDDSTKNMKIIETKTTGTDGTVTKNSYNCANSKQKIVLAIPEDDGLAERMQAIVDSCNKRGVTVELVSSYGKGARTSEVTPSKEGEEG